MLILQPAASWCCWWWPQRRRQRGRLDLQPAVPHRRPGIDAEPTASAVLEHRAAVSQLIVDGSSELGDVRRPGTPATNRSRRRRSGTWRPRELRRCQEWVTMTAVTFPWRHHVAPWQSARFFNCRVHSWDRTVTDRLETPTLSRSRIQTLWPLIKNAFMTTYLILCILSCIFRCICYCTECWSLNVLLQCHDFVELTRHERMIWCDIDVTVVVQCIYLFFIFYLLAEIV